MWTAKLLRLNKQYGRVEFEISYSNGTKIFDKTYQFESITKEAIKKLARTETKRLTDNDAEIIDLVPDQDIDLTEPTLPIKLPITKAEKNKNTWFNNWYTLLSLQKLADNGLIDSTDTRIINLRTGLITNWKPSYLEDI